MPITATLRFSCDVEVVEEAAARRAMSDWMVEDLGMSPMTLKEPVSLPRVAVAPPR